ncbi:CCD15 protein, partial [Thalassarche chlororhynchos]|nr:CCD15 protein [Thalassarche chlororhynchos]
KEQQREKAASLRRFQGEAERESCIAMQYSDSALHLTPRKNTCLFRSHPAPAICGAGARAVPAQRQGMQSEPFQQQAAKLSKTVKQVRRKLASCKTVPQGAGPPELPGGVWRREKPESCKTATVPAEDESEELLLAGHHDLPAELQDQGTAPHQAEQDDDFYIKIEFAKFCDGSVKDSSLPESPQRLHADYQAPLVLWAGVDQEETKKQVCPLEPSPHCFVSVSGLNGWDGEAPSLSMCVPAGLRARRRTSAGRKSRGCRRRLSGKNPPREREPVKPWPSLNWRRGE